MKFRDERPFGGEHAWRTAFIKARILAHVLLDSFAAEPFNHGPGKSAEKPNPSAHRDGHRGTIKQHQRHIAKR
jgi:hypothetical protein